MSPVTVLEIGRYIVPAYAGMVLAEQGVRVIKVRLRGEDPTLSLRHGDVLWAWLNKGKEWVDAPKDNSWPTLIRDLQPQAVICNLRPLRGGCPGVHWVQVVPVGERSFDIVAQAQAWADFAGTLKFYAGDTITGLWAAFLTMALIATRSAPQYVEIPHAAALAKMVEGELISPVAEVRQEQKAPLDRDVYGVEDDAAVVAYNGALYREPFRDLAWRRKHLPHHNGRIYFPSRRNT